MLLGGFGITAIAVAPAQILPRSMLAEIYESLERSDEAADLYRRILEIDPDLTGIKRRLSRLEKEKRP